MKKCAVFCQRKTCVGQENKHRSLFMFFKRIIYSFQRQDTKNKKCLRVSLITHCIICDCLIYCKVTQVHVFVFALHYPTVLQGMIGAHSFTHVSQTLLSNQTQCNCCTQLGSNCYQTGCHPPMRITTCSSMDHTLYS